LSLNQSSLRADAITCVRGERALFTGLDLEVTSGEWLHIRGENGIGKTSLLRLLSGLSKPAAGCIFWNNQPLEYNLQLAVRNS